jgi:hypothetical protein
VENYVKFREEIKSGEMLFGKSTLAACDYLEGGSLIADANDAKARK